MLLHLCVFNRFFPKIFGKNEDLPLDLEGSWSAFKKLTEQVREGICKILLLTVFWDLSCSFLCFLV